MAKNKLISNVKIITSGLVPTVDNLKPGEAAFGKLTSDGKYHLFGNTGEGGDAGKVVDIILDTYSGIPALTLDEILKAGNTTTISIQFNREDGKLAVLIGNEGLQIGTTTVKESGFKDNGFSVLSANKNNEISESEATQMRLFLSTYSKSEVDNMVAGIFHVKGSVNSFNDLPTDAKAGDVYNIRTAGGTDMHGISIKAGDNVVYVDATETEPAGWDVLSGFVDLSDYYTKNQVDNLIVGKKLNIGINNESFNDIDSNVVEGDDTTKNNHIEGSKNRIIKAHKEYPNENNHVEGKNNIAGGFAGHVENNSNQTYETNAHAGGVSSVASGAGTFAQGRGVIAMGLGSVATGQSLYNSDGSTTVLGVDGEETEIDWVTHVDETEQQRSKRIADRIEGLYLGTELKQDGTPNTSIQRKFLASLGTGNMVGGVNSFARGTANLVHGLGCRSLSSYCFAGGYYTWIGKNSDDCFAFGDHLQIGDNAKDTIVLGTAHNVEASGAFVVGYQCTIKPTAKNSFTLGKNCWIEAPNSYALGERIFINQDGQIVFGKYNDNNSSAIFVIGNGTASDRKNIFEVFNTGKVAASSYQGEGSKIDIAKVVEANPSVEPENLTFKTLTIDDYTNGNLTTNTEQGPGSVNYGLKAVIDYSSKTTFWHSKYDVIDGQPVPNPLLTDDNPYMISLKVDAEMVKTFTDQLIIRFYPRENQDATTGVWSINPGNFPVNVRIRIGGQSATFNNLTIKDYSNIDTEANNSFYHDFIVPFDGVLTEGSEISFDILKVPSVSAEYPNGKFACAQGIRFGYSNYSTVTKPDVDVSTVGNIASKVNKINDGAYYSTKQLLMMIKANTPSIPENVVTTDNNGNITIKAGATIAPTDTGAGVGKIKFSENGFSLRITSAANTGLVFDTVGVKLTDNNYKLTSPSTDWTSYELGSDLNSLHSKVKNALTTDKANVANGYAALDANKNINVVGMKIPCNTYPSGEAGTTDYLGNGVQSNNADGFTISSPYYGWYIKFTPSMPGEIFTNYPQMIIKNATSSDSFCLYNADPYDENNDAILWVNKYGSDNKWSVVRKVVNIDETKQDKPTINSIISSSTITLTANTEYHHIKEDSSTLTFTLPTTIEEDYQSYISFKSGATATTITISTFDGTLKFKGDDCANGIFTPAANTVYEVALKCVGMDSNNKPYIVARVGAC